MFLRPIHDVDDVDPVLEHPVPGVGFPGQLLLPLRPTELLLTALPPQDGLGEIGLLRLRLHSLCKSSLSHPGSDTTDS